MSFDDPNPPAARTTGLAPPPTTPPRPFIPLPWHPAAAIALRTHRIVLLLGEPGCGKTEFVHHLCHQTTGRRIEELQGGPKVDDLAFFGRFTLAGDTTPFVDGPLARALKAGTWFVLNDAGQVPFAQLSALLPLRHGDELVNPMSQERLSVPAAFRLVLTTNRENAACRNNTTAMQSLLDGALVVDVPDPGEAEVRAVLRAHEPSLDDDALDRVLEIRRRFEELSASSDRHKVRVGIRAMLQLSTLLRAGLSESDAIAQAVVGKFLLDKDRYDAGRLTTQMG